MHYVLAAAFYFGIVNNRCVLALPTLMELSLVSDVEMRWTSLLASVLLAIFEVIKTSSSCILPHVFHLSASFESPGGVSYRIRLMG